MLIDEEYETPYNDLHTRAFLIKCRHQSKCSQGPGKKYHPKRLLSYAHMMRPYVVFVV